MAPALCLLLLLLLLPGLTVTGATRPDQRMIHGPVLALTRDRASSGRPPQAERGPSRQQVVVAMERGLLPSALRLFDRHSPTSALLLLCNGSLETLGGSLSSDAEHELTVLGHGSPAGATGGALLSGHTAGELVWLLRGVLSALRSGLRGITVLGCDLGKDTMFMSRMLCGLRSVNVHSTVSFFSALVSVGPAGDVLTESGGVWRSHDHSGRVTARVDSAEVVWGGVELGCPGPPHKAYGQVLFAHTLDWPSQPQMFVPKALRKKYPSIDCLEGLTWSLFFEENEKRRAADYSPRHEHRNLTAVWLSRPHGPAVVKHIVTIQDLQVEIRYSAREHTSSTTLYALNDCVYQVHWSNLSVSLVGKFLSSDATHEIETFLQSFSDEAGSIDSLQTGLKASRFHEFCRQTFQLHHCSYNCELWGQYFMAAVFSASVVNFRVFSLFLMSVISCEVGLVHGVHSPVCTSFVGDVHPMATELPRPSHSRRGFYGGTLVELEQAPPEQQIWLEQVVAKENALYAQAGQMMSALDHDEQTELEIFGRVKVMNKYVFSSYMEFFRGTPEGKRLKTGCTFMSADIPTGG